MQRERRSESADWQAREGAPAPLGVSVDDASGALNFALYSKHATAVRLLLFQAGDCTTPLHGEDLLWRRNKSGRIWHCRIPAALAEQARYYAYQVDGPRDAASGHRFDPDKLLLDPYARAVHFPPGFSRSAAAHPGANPGRAPLGVIRPEGAPVRASGPAPRHTHDAVIYELHVRGFTRRANSGVAPERRGTFAGLVEKIPYLKELGVTIVELLPVFQFDPQEGNYWGYMPLGFFALHGAYGCRCGCGEQLAEFRAMVEALHAAGIEVILDVVYNHTAEGDETGPTYSLRGIDNTTYYLLEQDRSRYRNDSGAGNVVHTANRYVGALILDSLRYWAGEMGVDGFRFDLASLFTRRADGSIDLEQPPIIAAIQSDPLLAGRRLIAEAWDLSSYQLGRTFPGISWLQWNGQFRDQLRRFVRGDPGQLGELMTRLYGSSDLFPDTLEDAFHAFQSVNFVTSHDGFCLCDLLSYDAKHNEANGQGNRDGSDANYSWNHGWEGEEGAPAEVLALRRRQAKNLIALLMLANGTPMLVAGDEFLQTQGGNNNPYNQDNETTWLDWDRLEPNREIFRFAKAMIAFRKAHPGIARSRFWRDDVSWFGPSGPVDLGSQELAYRLAGASEGDCDLYVMINGGPHDVPFELQAPGIAWRVAVDTAAPPPDDVVDPGAEPPVEGSRRLVAGRSLVVLVGSAPAADPAGPVREGDAGRRRAASDAPEEEQP
ncbi:glycogen operon protein [Tistlia consotensis]|uniref:Glycogen operon protein n=1 Tax=Tistlia consotensis USBA 355 TaxID=560819 RepID=A0A1Y6CD92_9PROT|nr:isoamylase [Tistlia consotensis]SMF48400.1 glycogen operon protein [Tistlia consotensis USBA 355]SNR81271.1 glycogen operon protein [Tistlia consotensis]